ncbi:MAG: hypothetical protein V9G19_15170 [Tetrasphaera sp.]
MLIGRAGIGLANAAIWGSGGILDLTVPVGVGVALRTRSTAWVTLAMMPVSGVAGLAVAAQRTWWLAGSTPPGGCCPSAWAGPPARCSPARSSPGSGCGRTCSRGVAVGLVAAAYAWLSSLRTTR